MNRVEEQRPGPRLEREWRRPAASGQWSEAALRVLRERYLLRDDEQIVETPEEMCWRVACAVAAAERSYGRADEEARAIAVTFYEDMVKGRFLPNSPTLMNAGRSNGLQYSACFVLPVEDSLEGIFDAVKNAAIIHQSGGGTGFAFSRLRAKDSPVRRSGGHASGPVSFLRVFDAATESVKQGGRRRGANMGVLRVDHPDVFEFIACKLAGGITNFNISLGVTDEFMRALAEDRTYALVAPETGEPVREMPAREVWEHAVEAAWKTGDPGLIFLDRVNRSPANPVPDIGQVEATNPCGEQPLLPNEACNLGSLNLGQLVRRRAEVGAEVDWDGLKRLVWSSVRFLDNVIEVNPYPLPDIDRAVKQNRRIGLGVMGWADTLFKLGIPYDSEEALELADRVMAFIQREGHAASEALADERGPFPNWEHSIYRHGRPVRNSTVTTIAPTGTISIIAGCSSGIEPIFALAFRHIVGERELSFLNPVFEETIRQVAGERGEELVAIASERGTLAGVAGVPERFRRIFVTAHEVHYGWHIRMQAAFQRHTDNGVSKTINLPHHSTMQDVGAAYRLAYDAGCLGITVFRDGCKGTQVLHVGANPQSPIRDPQAAVLPRPDRVAGVTYRMGTPLGNAFVTVNETEGEPFEVFLNVGKAGSDIAAVSEALGRLISLVLRMPSALSSRERIEEIIDQLSGIGGGRHVGFGPRRVRSLPDAIARVLAAHLGVAEEDVSGGVGNGANGTPRKGRPAAPASLAVVLPPPGGNGRHGHPEVAADLCPDCGNATMVHEEGCLKCESCGFSEC